MQTIKINNSSFTKIKHSKNFIKVPHLKIIPTSNFIKLINAYNNDLIYCEAKLSDTSILMLKHFRIIDAHAHVVSNLCGITSNGELSPIGDGKVTNALGDTIQILPQEYDKSFTYLDLLNLMKKNGISHSILLQGNWLGLQNLYTNEAQNNYPVYFTKSCSFDLDSRNLNKIKDHFFNNLGFKHLKLELSTGSGYFANHKDRSFLDSDIKKIFEYCSNNKITMHLDLGGFNTISNQIQNIKTLIDTYDNIYIICHLTGPRLNDYDTLKSNLTTLKSDNIYFDLASLPSNTRPADYPFENALEYIKLAKDIVGADKLLFATDVPSTLVRNTYSELIEYLLTSKLFNIEQLYDVFFNNSAKIIYRKR